jgi:hypothetical protein
MGKLAQGDRFVLEVADDGTVYLMRGVRSWLLNYDGKGDGGYDQESLYLERYQAGAWQALLATSYPTQDNDGFWSTTRTALDGDMALDAAGNTYVAWMDDGEA